MVLLEKLSAALAPWGLFVRGGFQARVDDNVPPLPDGRAAATVVLAGNAGDAMWRIFAARERPGRNPLDDWLRPGILAAADTVGAHAILPNEGPYFPPIQDWAARAEPVYRSPTGIMIHPEFGLWHVYRAAFVFAESTEPPPRDDAPSPCEACAGKPCLKVCPADAFKPDRFDVAACVGHVDGPLGAPCRERGCMARRACPVGREHTYPRAAQDFHTSAFLRAARRFKLDPE